MGEGYGKAWNALVERGVIAHLPGRALKVYFALMTTARNRTLTCWPGVRTISRLSGVAESRVSETTGFLARHGLIEKGWLQIGGKPRRAYRLIEPSDTIFPDLRGSCSVCMDTDHRESCALRDLRTGRLFGKRPRSHLTDHRDAHSSDHRDSSMSTDDRGTNQTEPDEKIRSRRGDGVIGEEESREAPLRSLNQLAPPHAPSCRTPSGVVEKTPRDIQELVDFFAALPKPPSEKILNTLRRDGWTETQLKTALDACWGEALRRPEV